MSDVDLDDLADAARNRGLKLVRSRVRTPGKRRFGKVGLTDKSGRPVFGMDAKGPVAKPEDVESYLRGLGATDWGASLDVAAPQRKRNANRPPRAAANDEDKPERRPPRPKPQPTPQVRDARPSDAPLLVELIGLLGHEIDEKSVRKNLSALKKERQMPLVAVAGKEVIGLCGVSARVMIHREVPLGRITILVVAKEARDRGIGRMLLDAAEEWMRKRGCKLVEVTSNDRLTEAHAFYRHMGFERTSIRFAKKL